MADTSIPTVRATQRRRSVRFGAIALALVAAAVVVKLVLFPSAPERKLVTVPVERGSVEQTVLASGTLEPAKLVSVGAQVSGQITKLAVALGDEVEQGALIAEIDSVPQRNRLRDAEARLANVRAQRLAQVAQLAQAEQSFQRQRTMLAADATPRSEYEAAEAGLKAARAQIGALDAQLDQAAIAVEDARVDIGYTRVVAPMAGTVVAIVAEEGQTVNANQSAPTIVKLAELGTMTVKAEISEADVVKVEPGQPVWFTILGEPDRRYEAELRTIEPAPESIATEASGGGGAGGGAAATAVYYNALFDVDNAQRRLRPSMTAQVHIVLAESQGVLTIPSSALGRRGRDGTHVVQVVGRRGAPEERRVRAGLDDGAAVEIIEGLREGEEVVVGEASPEDAASRAERPGMRRAQRRGPLGF